MKLVGKLAEEEIGLVEGEEILLHLSGVNAWYETGLR